MHNSRLRTLLASSYLLAAFAWVAVEPPHSSWATNQKPAGDLRASVQKWSYPLTSQDLVRDFVAPNDDYSAGHRGVDFVADESENVFAVANGTVRFAGQVAGRGVVSLELDDGYIAEVEPVCPNVSIGQALTAGQIIGTVCGSGSTHCPITCLHLSARKLDASLPRGFAYLSPLLFLGTFAESHLVAIGSLN